MTYISTHSLALAEHLEALTLLPDQNKNGTSEQDRELISSRSLVQMQPKLIASKTVTIWCFFS